MKIMDFLSKDAVNVNLKAKDKKGIIEELVGLLLTSGEIKGSEKEGLVKTLMDRESLGSTGIGQGIGIPHGKSKTIKKIIGAMGISKKGVNFESLDGELTYIFFLLVTPEESAGPHLKALARISRLLKDKYFRERLKAASTEKEAVKIVSEEDQKRH